MYDMFINVIYIFKSFGSYVGSEPNDLGAYADINRSSVVDFNDLDIFSGEWFWGANTEN